jgi:hypothetical protein
VKPEMEIQRIWIVKAHWGWRRRTKLERGEGAVGVRFGTDYASSV